MTKARKQELETFYKSKTPDAFYASTYDLAKLPGSPTTDPQEWKEFITLPDISDFIRRERNYLKDVELNKLMQDASAKDRAVGTAQLINSLSKLEEVSGSSGPIFIYSYIPLSDEEVYADNVKIIDHDIFRKDDDETI